VKGKNYISRKQYGQGSLQSAIKVSNRFRKQNIMKRLLGRYQKEIDVTLATACIGVMFLTGIWSFLVQLAGL